MTSPRRRRRLLLAALLATLLPAPGVASALPGSDSFGAAPAFDPVPPLLFSEPGRVNTAPFGVAGEPVCPGMTRTAWWRFAGTGQPITLSTAGSSLDTIVAVYNQGANPPAASNRAVACNVPSFASERGRTYLVQVSGVGMAGGSLSLSATAPRPINDDRADAQRLQTGVAGAGNNVGASQELGEKLDCGPAPFTATTWFRWTAPTVGDAVFSASLSSPTSSDTVLVVHRASDGAIVGCNDDVVAPNSASQLDARVSPGDYLLQIGAKGVDGPATGQGNITANVGFTPDLDVDNDGVLRSSDCNDSDPSIRPGIVDVPDDRVDQDCSGADAVNLDRDRDGVDRPADCDDSNAKIRPGAVDVPGNKIDEDCSGRPAPFPRLASSIRTASTFPPFRFTKLTIANAVAGSRIELRFRGRGWPTRKPKVIRVRKSRKFVSVLSAGLKRARPRRGAVLEIRITKRRHIGVMRRVTVRGAGTPPRLQDLCLPVGKVPPRRC